MSPIGILVRVFALFLLACGAFAFAAMLKGCFLLRRQRGQHIDETNILLKSPLVPPVSVLTAPIDASPASCTFVRRLLALHYSRHEVVVVLDGPSETELAKWIQEFRLGLSARHSGEFLPAPKILGVYESHDPLRLVVVHQQAGGVIGAMNNAVNLAESPVVGLIESTTFFEPTVLLSMIQPMLERPDSTAVVCGTGLPPIGRGHLARFGALEFLRMFLARCGAFAASDSLMPVPGSTVLILRDTLTAGGGFRKTVLETCLNLQGIARRQRQPFRVGFVPKPVCYRPPAENWNDLRRAVMHDQAEIGSALRSIGRITGGMGSAGRALPSLLMARLVRPLVETIAYVLTAVAWAAGWIDGALAGVLLLATIGTGIVLSMAAVVLWDLSREEGTEPALLVRLFAEAVPENLGYRQIRNLWLVAGFFKSPAR